MHSGSFATVDQLGINLPRPSRPIHRTQPPLVLAPLAPHYVSSRRIIRLAPPVQIDLPELAQTPHWQSQCNSGRQHRQPPRLSQNPFLLATICPRQTRAAPHCGRTLTCPRRPSTAARVAALPRTCANRRPEALLRRGGRGATSVEWVIYPSGEWVRCTFSEVEWFSWKGSLERGSRQDGRS